MLSIKLFYHWMALENICFFKKKKFLSGPQCVRTRVVFSEDLGFRPQCPHFGQQISTTPVLGALKSGLLRHPGMHMENTPT